jgi:hypothetical protein
MRKLAVVGVAAAMLAVVAPALAAGPMAVKISVSPTSVYFADTVTARVEVLFDRRQVVADSIRVNPSFGPWAQLEPARSSTEKSGAIARRTWWFTLDCLTIACVPKGTVVQPFHLPSVTITAQRLDGSSLEVRRAWPALKVAGRFLPPVIPDVRPVFKLQTALPPAAYRLDPTSFALALDLIGAIVIALGLALGGREFAVKWAARHQTVDTMPPLMRALALVRQAQAREVEDRRRAVGLLARALRQGGDGLTAEASEVAWSIRDPTPGSLDELARTVEGELEESK